MSKIDWYLRSHLKFKHLQLLITVDELRHIGKTAEYLNISQPAVSKALTSFEEGLNIKIFERTTREIKPTEAGECLIRYARFMMEEMTNVRKELSNIHNGLSTRITLGVLPMVSLTLVPELVAKLESDMLSTQVEIQEGTSDTLLNLLKSNAVDLIIGNMTKKPKTAGIQSEFLFQDKMCIAVRQSHPLAQSQEITWSSLSGYSMILPPEFAISRMAIEEALSTNNVEFARNYVESLSALSNIGILLKTNALAFMPYSVAQYFVEKESIRILPLSLDNVTIDIGVFWLADKKLTPSLTKTIELLKDSIPEHN